MKILRLYIDGYKNLIECEIRPSGMHAITGFNGSGKSNFLEIFQFIAALLSADDDFRDSLLIAGNCPTGSTWFPIISNDESPRPFQFEIECEITLRKATWIIHYSLEIAPSDNSAGKYSSIGKGVINHELVKIKKSGAPGPLKLILERSKDGSVISQSETILRRRSEFKTKKNMSALQTLEVIEADEFESNFPVLQRFRNGLLTSDIVKLDPNKIIELADSTKTKRMINRNPGKAIRAVPLVEAIEMIQNDALQWKNYLFWLKTLCNIDDITLKSINKDIASKINQDKFVLIYREGHFFTPNELSTGNIVLLGLVTALLSVLINSGVVIFEEPETYIHPKALSDLIKLLRVVSETKSVIFSTHSPVALNSMDSNEVTLMKSIGNGKYTTLQVKDIEEAANALARGYLSFGDLLQTNFMSN